MNRSVALAGAVLVSLSVAGLLVLMDGSAEPTPVARSQPALPEEAPVPEGPAAPAPPPAPETARAEGVLEVAVLVGNTPVPGARVQVYRRGGVDARLRTRWDALGEGDTDAAGQRVLPVPPGSYFVAARAPGFAPAHATGVHPPGTARTALLLRLEPEVEVVGSTVVLGTGVPVSLAEVLLIPHASPPDLQGRVEAPAEQILSTSSSETGEFRFTGVAPGRYRAEARAPGYVTRVLPSTPVPFGAALTLALIPGDPLEGVVLGADARPVVGAEVLASGEKHASTAVTDERGSFVLVLPPDTYAVSARKAQEAGALDARVPMVEEEAVQGLRIPLGAGARLDGRVTWADGSPVLGARVEVRPRRTRGISGLAGTDAEGAFLVAPLAPGPYDVQVRMPEGARLPTQEITVGAGERVSLTLVAPSAPRAPSSLQGRVINTRGHPVESFHLEVESLGEGGDSRAFDFMGDRFELKLPVGRYRLFVALDSGERLDRFVDVPPGDTPSLEVPVYPGVPLTGRVVDATTHEPVAGVSVFVPRFAFVVTRPDGRFLMRDLPPGEHALGTSRGSVKQTHPVTLVPGQAQDLGDLALPAP